MAVSCSELLARTVVTAERLGLDAEGRKGGD